MSGLQSGEFDRVKERYARERSLRLAADGERRYVGMDESSPLPLSDPYTAPSAREVVEDAIDVLVVGGGFAGLLAATAMRTANVGKTRIIEAAGDVGGTWYWNRYPGAACDIESYIYLPLLEETGYMPVERYSKAAEIRAHCQRIAKHFQLYDNALFSTKVESLVWDGAANVWTVRTNRGDRIQAKFIVLATGPLNRPKLPAVAGLGSFKGQAFHTSRWDYAYTGGSATEPLSGLDDKRVGIIGTGATAIQCVPPLGASAKHLYVFQRTPSSVDVRNNSATDMDWAAGLGPGWQKARIENFTAQMEGRLEEEDQVGDGWTTLARAVRQRLASDPGRPSLPSLLEQADLEKMVAIRARIDEVVTEKATAEALKPWFSLFCKRPCFHDDYLATFNKQNVSLVDTKPQGIEAINEHGVVVAGRQYDLDCLIFATGFETASDYSERAGMRITGTAGCTLTEKWSSGMATLHGMHARGFSNCFIISQAQSGMSPNFPHMLAEQAQHIAYIVDHAERRGIDMLEVSEQAEQAWVQTILKTGEGRRKLLETCTPGYYNNEGRLSQAVAQALPFGAGPVAFIELLREWRAAGDLAGLELDKTKLPATLDA